VQSLPSSVQLPATTHSTQRPLPLQTPPVQGVLAGWFAITHVPALQVTGAVHSLLSSVQSVLTTQPVQFPAPSQTPLAQGVPAGWLTTTQLPAGQVAGAVHWLPSSAQSVGARHCTQTPAPLQSPSPTAAKSQAVPESEGVLPGHPLTGLQAASSVHWLKSSQLRTGGPTQTSGTQVTFKSRV
jgi:hypothetical protein